MRQDLAGLGRTGQGWAALDRTGQARAPVTEAGRLLGFILKGSYERIGTLSPARRATPFRGGGYISKPPACTAGTPGSHNTYCVYSEEFTSRF